MVYRVHSHLLALGGSGSRTQISFWTTLLMHLQSSSKTRTWNLGQRLSVCLVSPGYRPWLKCMALWQLFLFWALSGSHALRYVLNRYNYCKAYLYISKEYSNEFIIIYFSALKFTLVFEYFQKNHKTPCSMRIYYGETDSTGKQPKIIYTQFQSNVSEYFVHNLILPWYPKHCKIDISRVAQLKYHTFYLAISVYETCIIIDLQEKTVYCGKFCAKPSVPDSVVKLFQA